MADDSAAPAAPRPVPCARGLASASLAHRLVERAWRADRDGDDALADLLREAADVPGADAPGLEDLVERIEEAAGELRDTARGMRR